MMRTSLRRNKGEHGFTLIEMLVVLAIIGLLSVVAIVARPRSGGAVDRARTLVALRQALEQAREQAVASQTPVLVDLGNIKSLPVGARYSPAIGADERHIFVYPDGSSTGGILSAGGMRPVTIGWLDSEVGDAA